VPASGAARRAARNAARITIDSELASTSGPLARRCIAEAARSLLAIE
jgi:hypothetical protein